MTKQELARIEAQLEGWTVDSLRTLGNYEEVIKLADVRALIAEAKLLRELLQEASDAGYLKTKHTDNELLEARIDNALYGRPLPDYLTAQLADREAGWHDMSGFASNFEEQRHETGIWRHRTRDLRSGATGEWHAGYAPKTGRLGEPKS